jgi:hypothetical protein
MNALEARKQLLIAESEINRVQLVQEWQTLADEMRSVVHQTKSISAFAFAATALISGIASFRRIKSARSGEKRSWWQTLLKGVQLAGPLWAVFSPRSKS